MATDSNLPEDVAAAAEQTSEFEKFEAAAKAGTPEEPAEDKAKAPPAKNAGDAEADAAADADDAADAADAAEDDEGTDDEGTDDAAKADDKPPLPKSKKTVQARFNEFRHALGESERREAALMARLEALEKGTKAPAKEPEPMVPTGEDGKPLVEPKADDFKFGEVDPAYIKALAKHEIAVERAEMRKVDAAKAETQRMEQARVHYEGQRESMVKAAADVYPDFVEKVIEGAERKAFAVSAPMAGLILESEHGHHVAYYLATHPKEAREVYGKSDLAQAAYFGRLEARLSAEKSPKAKAKADTPILDPPPSHRSRGVNGTFSVGPDTDDFAAFERMATKKA